MEKIKNGVTELVFILDRSGSMRGLEADTIGGFNSVMERHAKEDAQVLVTTVLFDDRIDRIHDRIPIRQVPEMTEKEYYVRGCTALLDAVGSSIRHIAKIHKYARPEDRPRHRSSAHAGSHSTCCRGPAQFSPVQGPPP